MNRTLYFSKVSLDSQDLYKFVEDDQFRFKLTNDIISMLKHNSEFSEIILYTDDEGKEHQQEVKYTLSIKSKDDSTIYGYLDRKSNLYVKNRNAEGVLITRPVGDTEAIEFYYDVLHEYIAYDTRKRFGKNMFNEAFASLMNHCAKQEGFTYSFYLGTYNAGMSISQIQESIKKDKHIKELIITYRPANPDEKLIKKVREASESDKIKASNATERSIIYKAKGKDCINGGAKVIQEDLRKLVELNEGMDIEDMTQFSYAEVKSLNENGEVKSTADTKPFIRKVKDGVSEFLEEAVQGILQIIS